MVHLQLASSLTIPTNTTPLAIFETHQAAVEEFFVKKKFGPVLGKVLLLLSLHVLVVFMMALLVMIMM